MALTKMVLTGGAVDLLRDIAQKHHPELPVQDAHPLGNDQYEVTIEEDIYNSLMEEKLEWETSPSQVLFRLANPEGKATQ